MTQLLFFLILCPAMAGALVLLLPRRWGWLQHLLLVTAAVADLIASVRLLGSTTAYRAPWGGFGMRFELELYYFNSYMLAAAASFGVLIALYCAAFMRGRASTTQFYAYFLFTLAFTNGSLLADDLLTLLFFWEGLLGTLFGMIYLGGPGAFKTAGKALIINGVTDLCLMAGIALTIQLAGTSRISDIHLPLGTLGSIAFLFLMIGAASKAGAMPFHSWIPDAAEDAPLPFMALVPAALEKLLGIYLLARITMDLYQMTPNAWVSTVLMIIGAVTIVLAVLMALIQKDYKKLLSFHAVSQVGYMILGIGTAVPAGIVGGIFHMINHAMYKSCLFLTGGCVEKQTGTTDLQQLGGIGRRMPITCACFIVAALSISGMFPLNGFFSKELVYEGALHRGWIFYAAALLGSFLTAASFLKLCHAAYFGKARRDLGTVREAGLLMLIPICVLAALCILFGVNNSLPLHVVQNAIGEVRLMQHHFGGMPQSAFLVTATLLALGAAVLNHWWGVRRSGDSLKAVDHIHHAPVLHSVYARAEQRRFDPYEWGMSAARGLAALCRGVDRGIDGIYNVVVPGAARTISAGISAAHTGSFQLYLGWCLIGFALILLFAFGQY